MRLSGLLLIFIVSVAPCASAQLTSRVYASGFANPVGFVQDPTDSAVQYVIEQTGRIRAIRSGVLMHADFLDLRGIVTGSLGEQGLLGLAFAPDYATSGRFFVNFTNVSGDTVVARFKRSSNRFVADPSTRFDLRFGGPAVPALITQPFANHNGGNLVFGPFDGYLYIGLGDGGSGGDPGNRAQNPAELLGKMLRIDVNVADGDPVGYRIPSDNPFVGSALPGVRPEIWGFGFRNPWRYSFDDPSRGGTGALIVGDVGQGEWEEVDYEPALRGGRNYGWRLREGAHDFNTSLPPAYGPLIEPIHEYSHAVGVSVTAGFVYRGRRLPQRYFGRYFFADLVGRVWSVALNIDSASGEARATDLQEHTEELGVGRGVTITSFGVDSSGELYIVTYGGQIRVIESLAIARPATNADVDGDTRSDVMVWRASTGTWFWLTSSTAYGDGSSRQFGNQTFGDVPLNGDIDGDGRADLIVWRASTGTWFWTTSSSGYTNGGSRQFGNQALGDVPIAGDIDGDARMDLIVWRASTGEWIWTTSSSGFTNGSMRQFGNQGLGDVPMSGDVDGDGRMDLIVWRASTGFWYWVTSSTGFTDGSSRQFGNQASGDVPLLGDFDGDHKSDLVVWRASIGTWFWTTSSTGYVGGATKQWGNQGFGDVPRLGDLDGDGLADLTVWRASTGTWYWLKSSTGFSNATGGASKQFGNQGLGDVPMMK
jgi:glucose/arabinose dehydrogenase